MSWVPAWIGNSYSRLYAEFLGEYFTVLDASKLLGREISYTRVLLSRMSKAGLVEVVKRGRRRMYRVKRPTTYILERAGIFDRLEGLKRKEYIPLLKEFISLCLETFGKRLRSIVLFGSIARGEVKPTSDLDLLVIADELPESYVDRVKIFVEIEREMKDLMGDLWRRGAYVTIQVHPLTSGEASRFRPLYLDIIFDSAILYDRGDFFQRVINRLRDRLEELGSRRIQLPNGSWYWIIKPRLEGLEVVEI